MVPEETLERAAVDDVSPRYLRKQKAAGPGRRRARQEGSLARPIALLSAVALVAGGLLAWIIHFLLFSPQMLLDPGRLQVLGTRYASPDDVAAIFASDLGRSVLRVPLGRRRAAVERLMWVKQARVERVLTGRLVVEVSEREPVAFLRGNSGMQWIDSEGVILDRQEGARLNLPVVSGLDWRTPAGERARRVGLFLEFLKEIAAVRAAAPAAVSEADLSSPDDLQVTLAGLPEFAGQGPVLVHFGDVQFAGRFQTLLEDFAGWRQKAGNIEAVDLRFDGQALVTPGPQAADVAPAPAGLAETPVAAAAGPAPKNSVAVSEKTRKGIAQR
ncbi:MAG TPA: FtsQ-type POTRA domain-containing protein [Candidatus Acidoferrales bacterium]|nr:FtsQ-type POTRA domain-containing protein [Candidatus Acidoferrales bacterium]